MRNVAAAVLAGVFVVVLSSSASAGGYEIGTDQGAEAVGRAGATTAYSNFMSTYSNIAGIADVPRYAIYLTDSLTFRRVSFTRTPEPATFNMRGDMVNPPHQWETAEDTTGVFPLGVGLAAHIRLTSYLVLSLGANGPTSVGWGNYEDPNYYQDNLENDDNSWVNELSGGARHDLTEMDVVFLWPTIGLGLTVPGYEDLRIGASFSPGFAHLMFSTYAGAGDVGEIETTLQLWDPFVPGGQIGLMWRIWRLDLGFQVRLSADINASGEGGDSVTATVHETDPTDPGGETEEAAAQAASFYSPWPRAVARFGIRYAHPREGASPDARMPWQRDLFDVELDVVYENNSQNDGFDVSIEDVELPGVPAVPQTDLFVRHDWQDTVSLRLGGSFHILDGMLTFSAGASWESPTVPESFTRLDYLGWMRIGLALGVTFRISIIEFSVAYQHIFMPDRDVEPLPEDYAGDPCEVRACQLNALGGGVTDMVINTGHYEASYDVLTFSLAFRWGEGSGARREEPALEQESGTMVEPEAPIDAEASGDAGATDEALDLTEPPVGEDVESTGEDGDDGAGGQGATTEAGPDTRRMTTTDENPPADGGSIGQPYDSIGEGPEEAPLE